MGLALSIVFLLITSAISILTYREVFKEPWGKRIVLILGVIAVAAGIPKEIVEYIDCNLREQKLEAQLAEAQAAIKRNISIARKVDRLVKYGITDHKLSEGDKLSLVRKVVWLYPMALLRCNIEKKPRYDDVKAYELDVGSFVFVWYECGQIVDFCSLCKEDIPELMVNVMSEDDEKVIEMFNTAVFETDLVSEGLWQINVGQGSGSVANGFAEIVRNVMCPFGIGVWYRIDYLNKCIEMSVPSVNMSDSKISFHDGRFVRIIGDDDICQVNGLKGPLFFRKMLEIFHGWINGQAPGKNHVVNQWEMVGGTMVLCLTQETR